LDEANAFVAAHHRHHKPVPGAKFCLAVSEGDKVRGVAIVGRPVARLLDNGWTLEVNRVCTDGARNACSMLYGAAWRAAKALGFRRLITYTLPEEGGASLRAGFRNCGMTKGGLIALQLLPEDMPKPARPLDDNCGQASLFEFAVSA